MSQSRKRSAACPEGSDFLKLVADQEDACQAETRRRIPDLGEKVPACFENLGTVLSLLDRSAACFWSCRGGDHVIEYLAGRVSSSSRAALRLLLFGFYDESLSITRGIGEIANLFLLFNQDPGAFPQWQQSNKKHRMQQFSPIKVRLRLEEIGRGKSVDLRMLRVDEQRYGGLCEIATHVTPATKPQAHNPLGMPFAGAQFQEAGLIVALNELAHATALALMPLPKLLGYDDQRRSEIQQAGANLWTAVGTLDVLTEKSKFEDMWQQTKSELKSSPDEK
jgi:hypothetical protein